MKLFLTDSRSKKKEEFIPQKEKEVTLYVCGPTVYDDAHLGHARSSINFDLLYRTLLAYGYDVKYAKNITDVDDKIIKKMKESGKSLEEITTLYTNRYNEEMAELNILPPTLAPKATEHISQMEKLVEVLLEKDIAYKISNGDIYLDVSKDSGYGKISNQTQDDVQTRVEGSEKRDSRDFVLWKAAKEGDLVSFASKIGDGRPGWHLECSAMVKEHLDTGDEFMCDIHGGGEDLFFPHHENEGSQCRCAYDKEIAKYWLHNGFVTIGGEKMSKSLGNSFFLKDALDTFSGEVIRFYLSSIHYRNDFNFNEEDLLASKKRLDKIYRLKKRIYGVKCGNVDKNFKNLLLKAMGDDLNVSVAFSIIDEMISDTNDKLDAEPKNKGLKQTIIANITFLNEVLGIGLSDPFEYFQFGVDEELKLKIENLIEKRDLAKKEKNFQEADEIRDEILSFGINIMDVPGKTLWEKV